MPDGFCSFFTLAPIRSSPSCLSASTQLIQTGSGIKSPGLSQVATYSSGSRFPILAKLLGSGETRSGKILAATPLQLAVLTVPIKQRERYSSRAWVSYCPLSRVQAARIACEMDSSHQLIGGAYGIAVEGFNPMQWRGPTGL